MAFTEQRGAEERLSVVPLEEDARSVAPFVFVVRPLALSPARVYIESLGQGSRRTMRGALYTLVQLLLPNVEDLTEDSIYSFPWEQLRFSHTSVLRARLSERYKKPSTANKHLAALRGVLKAAWQLELMSAEAYQKAASVKAVPGSTLPSGRSLKDGELRALLLACQKDPTLKGCRDLALIALLFATGLRRQEIVLLDLSDYDRDTHALRVRGKGQKERWAYVEAPGAYLALDAWIEQRTEEPGPLFPRMRKGGSLVREKHPSPEYYKEGKPRIDTGFPLQRLTEQGIYAILFERARQAEIPHLSPHDLRRTFVGELLDTGGDLSLAQKLAGHASPTTTARYDRRGEVAKKRAAGALHVPLVRWQGRRTLRQDE
jgi:site-specific recombinase XerD